MKTNLNSWLIISCFFYLFDLIVTCWLIINFGANIELNPFMRLLFQINPALVLFFKFGVLFSYIFIIHKAAQGNYSFAYRGTQIVCFLLVLVGIFHFCFTVLPTIPKLMTFFPKLQFGLFGWP